MSRAATLIRRLAIGLAACGALLALGGAASALAAPAPYWQLSASAVPAYLKPGQVGKIVVRVSNLGDVATSGPITIGDQLPAGLKLKPGGLSGSLADKEEKVLECNEGTLTCTNNTEDTNNHEKETDVPVLPYHGLRLTLEVEVEPSVASPSALEEEVTVTGGGAPSAVSTKQLIQISGEPAPFGIEKYSFKPEEEGGSADTRAGSHPFQLTTSLALNQNAKEEPVGLPKNLQFSLPPGLLGNPNAIPQCRLVDFDTLLNTSEGATNLCSPNTAIGVAEVTIDEPVAFEHGPGVLTVPVFNLEPAAGEPARFGLVAARVPVVFDTAVRTGSDYGVVVTASDTSEAAGVVASKVSFWGVPGDHAHDNLRGWNCVRFGLPAPLCKAQVEEREEGEKDETEEGKTPPEPTPFLSLPTSCTTKLASPMQAQSWRPGSKYVPGPESEFEMRLDAASCETLPFSPTISVTSDSQSGSTPAGLNVTIQTPQRETDTGQAESAVKSTTVTLPEGVQLNPAAAGGLQACTAIQVGFLDGEEAEPNNEHFSPNPVACPEASKVGSVSIKSPDLANPINGFVYLAGHDTSPFKAPLALYIVARDPVSGVLVKLGGSVTPMEGSGQIVSTFENTPQVPFESFKLSFFDGPRASISTPTFCGEYKTTTSFTPWSGNKPETPSSVFKIEHGPGGGECTSNSPQPFAPSFEAGSSNLQAGAFTGSAQPFTLTVGVPDGNQALTKLTTHLAPGMAAMLSSLTPCPIAQADLAQCGPNSLIGHSTSLAGLGSEPFALSGSAYLTGPYAGAPFGLSVATPAKAGPFNLGTVIANATIEVDPTTAAVTVTTREARILDPTGNTTVAPSALPTIIKGVPVALKAINVRVDRPNFEFNPTSCAPMNVTGALEGAGGASVVRESKIQMTLSSCEALPFAPKLTASTGATASKLGGANLNVKIESPGFGSANIAKVFLTLPIALPSRLTTIQKACPLAVFNANPATCDEGSLIGHATIHTPVLKSPVVGPAYLVSHGGASFPDVEFVLQAEGITLVLDGKTDIKNGITYSRFESAPDAPFTTFETELPTGPHSALTAYVPATPYNLCGSKLQMPTEITGQNGAVIKQTTEIAVTGCGTGAVESFKQKQAKALAKALAACKKKYKKNRHKRIACERAAHKKYDPKKPGKAKGKAKKK